MRTQTFFYKFIKIFGRLAGEIDIGNSCRFQEAFVFFNGQYDNPRPFLHS